MAVALAAVLAASPVPAALLFGLIFITGALEVTKLTKCSVASVLSGLLLTGAAILVSATRGLSDLPAVLGISWWLGAISLFVWKPKQFAFAGGLLLWLFAGAGAGMALQLQSIGSNSAFLPNLLLMALVPLWVGDSMAYFVGKAWGRHKLAPAISPNKTVEGAVANLVGCVAAGWGLGFWLGVPVLASIAVGLSAGVFGQAGDLLQSRLKRTAGVKDSGSLLPGHGGVLDRMDSFLFSSYPSMMLLLWLAPELFHVKQWPF